MRARRLAVAALVACIPTAAGAHSFDWGGANSWSVGELSNQYVVDGVTITVTIDDPEGALDAGTGPLSSPGSAQTSNYLNPTGNNGAESLFIKAPGNSNFVSLTVAFDIVVTDVQFATYDIDRSPPGSYTDTMHGVATLDGTNFFGPDAVTGNGSESWTLLPDGETIQAVANADQSGGNSANGTANWSFDAPLTSFVLTYTNANTAFGVQWTSLSRIVFQPEPSTGLLVGGGLVGMGIYGRRGSRARVARAR